MKTFFLSDLHLGDERILSHLDDKGKQLRPFKSLSDMENTIINNYNSTVEDQDTVYFLGDICLSRESLELINELNGTKILVRGNWEQYSAKTYLRYFQDVRGVVVFPEHKIIAQHYPIHTDCLYGNWKAINGHLHHKSLKDPRYYNVSPEVNNYHPVDLEDIIKTFKNNVSTYI